MADIITGTTHVAGSIRYKLDGGVWKYWNALRKQWWRCADNKPAGIPIPLDATHYGSAHSDFVTYYRLDGDIWWYWSNAYEEWRKVANNVPSLKTLPLETK